MPQRVRFAVLIRVLDTATHLYILIYIFAVQQEESLIPLDSGIFYLRTHY
jgi:hypothetical protein